MAHLQYMPGDPRLVDQLVYELKSKGIFDQFRKDCIADVDTRPAYQNLRQRVESSVAAFLSRQVWKPDLNKNQLREKLRKHLLDGNYLEQGVERIVDQVVNPKVASVFIPQVEDLVYNYLGIPRKKSTANPETSEEKSSEDLLPTDLEAVSPGSVKSNEDKNDKQEEIDTSDKKNDTKMDIDEKSNAEIKEDTIIDVVDSNTVDDSKLSITEVNEESPISVDKNTTTIPLPAEEIKLENIPAPENSPPNIKDKKIDLEKIDLPKEPNLSTDIPLPDEIPKVERESYFQPMILGSEDDSSSDSSLQRNMSPLTPIRNYNNENSYDAQQGFENDSDSKCEVKEPSTFRFTIENKSPEKSPEPEKVEKKDAEQVLSYQFTNQVNINTFNTPMYDDSSNSNNLQIDYESDVNSKTIDLKPPETDQNSVDSKKEKKTEEKKSSSHKSSHKSRDSHRHSSSSKDKRSESKHSSSRDSNRHDKKSSRDDKTKSTSHKDKPSDKGDKTSDKTEKKDAKDKDSSKHKSSSHKSSREKDSKHRSSSSSKHSSSKHDDKKSSSSSKDKSSEKSKDSKDKTREKSSSHRSEKDKDRKSSSSKSKGDEKENKEKKEKKETDDHYSLSGRGNPNRRSTDRDSNDGSSSSKGSQNPSNTKTAESKKESKGNNKSENTSVSDSTSPSDKDVDVKEHKMNNLSQKVVRVDTRLEVPIKSPPRLPFVPDVTLKKPRFAANLAEAKQMMKMRKFLEEEQKRMNQEAALLLEFQANVRPSLSQVYSSIPGPELEFACVPNPVQSPHNQVVVVGIENDQEHKEIELKHEESTKVLVEQENNEETVHDQKDSIAETLIAMHLEHNVDNTQTDVINIEQTHHDIILTLSDDDSEIKNEIENGNVELIICDDDVTMTVINEEDIEKSSIEEENFEVTLTTEENELENEDDKNVLDENIDEYHHVVPEETELHFFAEQEKYIAELERDRFDRFLKSYTEKIPSKLYLVNCDSYGQNLIKEVSSNFGNFEIVNYHKNGHLKIPLKNKNVIKNINLNTEVVIPPTDDNRFISDSDSEMGSGMFSPVKSESSFELHSDYDAKLEEMVNNASRQQIMEIILGNIEESPSKMPSIEYCMESRIESVDNDLKRKYSDMESNVNNNITVLTSNKIRKLSGSDQISSTTEETDDTPNNMSHLNNTRSKYLGKARRVGLPKPKRAALPNPNSPSSDQSVENYSNNARELTPVKKIKTPRNKVQRYDTSDLYKPKLHYLSRRNFTLNE